MRRVVPIFAVALAAGALPVAAEGSTASTRAGGFSSHIQFVADAGEANDVTVTQRRGGRLIAIADAGSRIEAGDGCRGGGALVLCKPIESGPAGLPGGFLPGTVTVRMRLGEGDDRYDGAALPRKLRNAPGGRADLDTAVDAGDGADTVTGGNTGDRITPGPGDDLVQAGGGLDVLVAGREPDGADVLDGGAGRDDAIYYDRADPVSLTLDDVANDGAVGEGDDLISVGSLGGGRGDDVLVGDDGANALISLGGDDTVVGLGGDDQIIGDDLFPPEGASTEEEARAAGGDDVLAGGDGDDQLTGMFGEDALTGGPGADGIDARLGAIISIFDGKSLDDRATDQVDCGDGPDQVISERRDALTSCEDEVEFLDDRGSRLDSRRVPTTGRK